MAAKGYAFVSPGSDPGAGVPLADPMFGRITTMGACRPDLRRLVQKGDFLIVVSGKRSGVAQYIIGALEVDEKLDHLVAHSKFPENRLRTRDDGVKVGNVIVTASGEHHPLDKHPEKNFEKRIRNYIVARDAVYLDKPSEVEIGRARSLEILRSVFDMPEAKRISEVVGRNRRLNEEQIRKLVRELESIKTEAGRAQSR